MTDTTISWTDKTWNPTRGCSLVNEDCCNCYAMKQAHRFSGPGGPYEGLTEVGPNGPRWNGNVRLVPEKLEEPVHWKKPSRVFVDSMSDLFHEDVPESYILAVFQIMARTPQHTYQILTKRPERMCRILRSWQQAGLTLCEGCDAVLPNVWLGTSAGSQKRLLEFAPWLLETPAAVRFLSLEPLLESIDAAPFLKCERDHNGDGNCDRHRDGCPEISWCIVGGESGTGARPFNIQWARDVVQQCRAAGVACFYKQGGSSNKCPHSSKGGHFECFPTDLKVREFPNAI